MRTAFRLLIGSIGDDIHSIGMALLTLAFREEGYIVRNLRIGNTLDEFFEVAHDFDAVFISCNNGHADLFLDDFPKQLATFQLAHDAPRLWYVGGNLSVKDSPDNIVRKYRQFGFDFVAPKPVSFEAISEQLKQDFHRKGIKPKQIKREIEEVYPKVPFLDLVNDEPMPDEEFHATRTSVLESWRTGSGVYDANIPKNHSDKSKNLHSLLAAHHQNGKRPLLQPRTGVAHVCDEINILKYLRSNGLDISSIQLDAASRKNMYAQAEEGVRRTEKGQRSFLNGYPIPVHGVPGMMEIMAAIETPFQVRAGSPDHRLTYEIALAGGASSLEGGFICYLYPYDKSTSPVINLKYWKYVDKLAGWYRQKYGVIIDREYFGPLTTTLIEPTIPITINIVQAIMSAKSGVRCISVGIAEQGNRIQDIAAIRVIDRMTRKYLAKYGFADCTVSTVYHHFMGAFPADREKSRDLIRRSSVTGALAQSTKFMVKTPVESFKIPEKEDNAEALHLSQEGIAMARDIKVDQKKLQTEITRLERQVISVMTTIEALGQGSIARGIIKAFEECVLDIPFSPSRYNRGVHITARDCDGAVRFATPEFLPFDDDIKDFHRERISQRMTSERLRRHSELLGRDLTRIWKNDYLHWPLDGHYVK